MRRRGGSNARHFAAAVVPAFWTALGVAVAAAPAFSHDEPFSYVDLRAGAAGVEATVRAPAVDWAHDLPTAEPADLLTAAGAERWKERLAATLAAGLVLDTGAGDRLRPELRGIEALPERHEVRLRVWYGWDRTPGTLRIRCRLFPYDRRHKTYLNLYEAGRLEYQGVFEGDADENRYSLGRAQRPDAVIREFAAQGVRHIFIGPDHVLFIVSLLLLGGTLPRLLKIVTAFTLAHSVTLVLATLGLLNPPARFVEPAIALSIVIVGVHGLLAARGTGWDPRLLFAFGFGLVHGFGFAGVLRELELPAGALGWSLFSFNVGVEIGQACIVAVVAPLLAAVRWRSPRAAQHIVTLGSAGVIAAGAFWFVQRLAS